MVTGNATSQVTQPDLAVGPAEDGGNQPGAIAMNWLANSLGVVLGLGVLGWLAGLI